MLPVFCTTSNDISYCVKWTSSGQYLGFRCYYWYNEKWTLINKEYVTRLYITDYSFRLLELLSYRMFKIFNSNNKETWDLSLDLISWVSIELIDDNYLNLDYKLSTGLGSARMQHVYVLLEYDKKLPEDITPHNLQKYSEVKNILLNAHDAIVAANTVNLSQLQNYRLNDYYFDIKHYYSLNNNYKISDDEISFLIKSLEDMCEDYPNLKFNRHDLLYDIDVALRAVPNDTKIKICNLINLKFVNVFPIPLDMHALCDNYVPQVPEKIATTLIQRSKPTAAMLQEDNDF